MPVFEYLANDSNGSKRRGTIDGSSAREARDKLREKGLRIVSLQQCDAGDSKQSRKLSLRPALWRLLSRRSKNQFVATFTGELATLLSVGIPLPDALGTLSKQYQGKWSQVLLLLQDRLTGGRSLAEAMSERSDIFDELCISMVRVGENTGNLDEVLAQLSSFKQKSLEFRDRLGSSLLYPAIVFAVSLVVAGFLMTVVVPVLLQNLIDADRELPWPTKILKTVSDLLVHYGVLIGIAVAVLGIVAGVLSRTPRGKRLWYTLILKLPIVGKLSQRQEISRVALVTATLLESGIEFLQAIEVAKGTTRNVLLREALDQCYAQVQSGGDLGGVLSQQEFFPPMVAQVFSVGQSSGRLPEMLRRLAEDYDRQVEIAAARISAVVEPVLIIGLSVFVGFILLATLLPILEAGNVLS